MTEHFASSEFADNPEARCPVVLLLDVSGSMGQSSGEERHIDALNAGLQRFEHDLQSDPLARKRCEVAIVSFGEQVQVRPFVGAEQFHAPTLEAGGLTPMGEAITQALALITERKAAYRKEGVAYYKPWVFLITDGEATDSLGLAAEQVQQMEKQKGVAFYSVMAGGTDTTQLASINPARTPLNLRDVAYRELFSWLSNSMASVSKSSPGTDVPLASPAGWGTP